MMVEKQNDTKLLYDSQMGKKIRWGVILLFIFFSIAYLIVDPIQKKLIIFAISFFIFIFLVQSPFLFLKYFYKLEFQNEELLFIGLLKIKKKAVKIRDLIYIKEKGHGRLIFHFRDSTKLILVYAKGSHVEKERIIESLKILSNLKKTLYPAEESIELKFIFSKMEKL